MQASRRLASHALHINSYCRRVALKTVLSCKPNTISQFYSTIPEPQITTEEKQFAPKIKQLVDEISQLNLIEVADLNELLKKTLNIQDAPMMAMGMAPAAAPKEDEEEVVVQKEKTIFSVKLVKFDPSKKINLIKAVKGIVPDLNLVQSKKFIESLPQVVLEDLPKEEAEKIKTELEAQGGTVEIA